MKVAILYHTPHYHGYFKNLYDDVKRGINETNPTFLPLRESWRNKSVLKDLSLTDITILVGTKKSSTGRGRYTGKIIQHQHSHKKRCLILERGYIGDRQKYWSVGFDGLNGRADFRNKNMPSDRFDRLGITLRHFWKKEGDILFCLQLPWDSSVDHLNYRDVVLKSAKKILLSSNKNIIFRFHPRFLISIPDHKNHKGVHDENICRRCVQSNFLETIYKLSENKRVFISDANKPITEEFRGKGCLVTVNSNSSVDAIIAGLPVVTLDEGSMVWDVSHNNLNEIDTIEPIPENLRLQKLYDIAYAQWSNEEISQGKPFKHLGII